MSNYNNYLRIDNWRFFPAYFMHKGDSKCAIWAVYHSVLNSAKVKRACSGSEEYCRRDKEKARENILSSSTS